MDKHLFLFGGGPPFTYDMAKQFVKIATKPRGPISILVVERDGWKEYMPKYTHALRELGINEFHFIPLPTTPVDHVIRNLKNSSGIILGGGDTNLYADFIVETPISTAIKEGYESGIPVAGFSAGALISPEICVISPNDNEQNEFQQRKGLGLVSDLLIAVHFSEWNEEEHLRNVVNHLGNQTNYGIDEGTCVYLQNGKLEEMEGTGVYSLVDEVLCKVN